MAEKGNHRALRRKKYLVDESENLSSLKKTKETHFLWTCWQDPAPVPNMTLENLKSEFSNVMGELGGEQVIINKGANQIEK